MSDGNKRNDDLQDYMDLLEEMSHNDISDNDELNDSDFDFLPPFEESEYASDSIGDELSDISDEFSNYETDDNENSEDIEDCEDILSNTPKEKNPFKRFAAWFKKLPKKKKIIVSIIAGVLALLIIIGSVLSIFVANKFNLLGDKVDKDEFDDIIYDDPDFGDIDIDIGSAGFKQSLIDWATAGNDNHISSKNVLNVLLVGADSRKGVNEGNTDVMMLVSLNKKTKQIKLVSFLRDSYLYIEGKNSSYCTKLNAAFSMGGAECLMRTIENNYKIDIDNYVMVNFESFKSIIDAMGGVTVDVKKYEADYNYKKFKISLPYGDGVKLNGEQALCFCRIRGCDADGDVSRTRRQRQVIESIIKKVSTASLSDLNKYLDILLPYVETGFSNSEILSLGMKALTGKWYNYEQSQVQMPDEECRTSGSANAWIWVVDYQLAAHKLQKELYGESNIIIDDDRISIIDVYNGATYKGSSSSSSGTGSGNSDSGNTGSYTTADTTVKTTSSADVTEKVTQSDNSKVTESITENQDETQSPITTEPQIQPQETEAQTENMTESPETEVPVTTPPPSESTPPQTEQQPQDGVE